MTAHFQRASNVV
jgi:aryl-alcohol dehydrogenase-like predicted oxidoreductase